VTEVNDASMIVGAAGCRVRLAAGVKPRPAATAACGSMPSRPPTVAARCPGATRVGP